MQDLIDAVNEGSAERIQQLIAHISEAEREAWLGQSVLRAAYENRCDSVRALLEVRASPAAQDKLGRTPLHWSAKSTHEEVARILVEGGASATTANADGVTPLHVAAEENAGSIVRLLLDQRADPAACSVDGRTPMHFAAEAGAAMATAVLLDKKASGGRHRSILESESDRKETPLARAAARGRAAVVQLLAKGGADVEHKNFWGQSPLQLAAHGGHAGSAAVLLEAAANVNSAAQDGTTPLHTACERGFPQVVELLLSHGASVTSVATGGRQPLHAAALRGCADACEALIAQQADPEAKTDEQRTALACAAARGHTLVVLRLLERYVDMDAADVVKQTPVHAAAAAGRAQVLEALADKRARIEDVDASNRTPLILALASRHTDAVKVLLKKGAVMPDEWRERPGIPDLMAEVEAELIREQLEQAAAGAFDPAVLQAAEREFEDARQKLLGLAQSMAAAATAPLMQQAEAELREATKLAKDARHAEEVLHFDMETLANENRDLKARIDENVEKIEASKKAIEDYAAMKQPQIDEIARLDGVIVERQEILQKCIDDEEVARKAAEGKPVWDHLDAERLGLKEEEERMLAELERIRQELAKWHAEKEEAASLHKKAHAILDRGVATDFRPVSRPGPGPPKDGADGDDATGDDGAGDDCAGDDGECSAN